MVESRETSASGGWETGTPLHVLLVKVSADGALLVTVELKRGDYDVPGMIETGPLRG